MWEPPEKPVFKTKKGHKLAVLTLILIVVASLYWGFESLQQSLKLSETKKTGWDLYQKQQAAQKLAELKTKDTDGDGLSDFDEQYIYSTSIFLDDTDSDNIKDKDEVNNGTNPLCKEGENCSQIDVSNETTTEQEILAQATPEEIREILKQAGITEEQLAGLSNEDLNKIYQEALQSTSNNTTSSEGLVPTAQELRQQLAAGGLDAKILESLDDATLLQIYQESVMGQNNNNTSSSVSNDNSAAALQDLNADEIRDLLKQAGMSDSDLENMDDDTIKRIFLENMPTE